MAYRALPFLHIGQSFLLCVVAIRLAGALQYFFALYANNSPAWFAQRAFS
jgi:hypothetical protein